MAGLLSQMGEQQSHLARNALLCVALASLIGCTGTGGPDPEIATGSDAQVTADGLHRLRHSGFQQAWVKPDAGFARYSTILLAPPQVAYKRVPTRRSGSMSNPNFLLSDPQMATFKRFLVEAFQQEFGKSKSFQVVDTPGNDTLLIETRIIDLIVLVPTSPRPVSENTFTTSTAVMTLVMELRDAHSGEILGRIAERREARAPGSNGSTTLTWSTSVNDAAAIRTTFRHWARILRERLDRVHELAPSGSSGETPPAS